MRNYLIVFCLILSHAISAQEDLLGEAEELAEPAIFEYPAFKAMRIGNLQSTKVAAHKDLYLYVSHRFGTIKDGGETFFGLDNAITKIQLVYGLLKNVQIGVSRESLRRTFASSAKIRLAQQTQQFPINLSVYSTVNYNSELDKERFPLLKEADRLSYASQLLISRRISNKLSLEIAPTFVRQNLVLEPFQNHEQFALGMGGRYKLGGRWSLNADYVANFSRADQSIYNNAFTIGTDLETGGHVFQLLFSNAQSANEPGFISNAEGDWSEGDIFFGFNIVRVF